MNKIFAIVFYGGTLCNAEKNKKSVTKQKKYGKLFKNL